MYIYIHYIYIYIINTYIYIYTYKHIKYIYAYIQTNNFIYFNHLIRRLSSWKTLHTRTFRREN